MVSLIYMDRLKAHLPAHARGERGTQHRLFLAASLLASKFLHDFAALSAKAVAKCRACHGLFALEDVRMMERDFLRLVGYQLNVDKATIIRYLAKYDQLFCAVAAQQALAA